jgi:adenylate cyclase
MTGHYDESIAAWKKALQKNSDYLPAHAFLAACYSSSGRDVEATAEMKEVLRIDPKFNVESHAKLLPYKNKADIEREVNALRKAGLPEKPSTSIPLSAEVAPTEKVTPPSPEKVTKPAPPPPPKEEVASKDKMAFPLPEEPSIAVLPFVNMSEDPKQEFLSDGISEEITTALSKIPRIFVISRQSAFSYKGKPVKVKQVSEELGVRYVLEGSVQRSADRIRINAQLIDALTGRHIWAERYNRDLKDLFPLQDEITMKILNAIQVKLTEGEQVLIRRKSGEEPRLECYLKRWEAWKYYEGFNRDSTVKARQVAEEVLVICPEDPSAYTLMGFVHLMESMLRMGKSPQESNEKAIEMAQKALAMDDSIIMAHILLCSVYPRVREFDKAIAEGERAVALNPGGSLAHLWYATSLCYVDRAEEAIPIFKKALRLNPFPNSGYYLNYGAGLRMTGRFEEAVSEFKKALQLEPNNVMVHLNLAATYSMMGQEKEARAEAEELLRLNPKFSLGGIERVLPYKSQDQKDRFIEALRKAGLK